VSAASGDVVTTGSQAVPVEAIEAALAGLWRPAVEGESAEAAPRTRACMSNLIVYCASSAQTAAAAAELPVAVQVHPARVLLLEGDPKRLDSAPQAEVSALCVLGDGGRQICSEHVLLVAGGKGVERLVSVARTLLIGDLPTALWWTVPEPPPLAGALFDELAELANQVIFDSRGWPDPVRGVAAMGDWAEGEGRRVADLSWRRLEPWRRIVARALDPAQAPGALAGLDEVRIAHGPHGLTQAWYLIGWLAAHLGWRASGGAIQTGVEIRWELAAPGRKVRVVVERLPDGPPEIVGASLHWQGPDGPETLRLTQLDEHRLAAFSGSEPSPRWLVATAPTALAPLVAAQLSHHGHDGRFRDTLRLARAMARDLRR
jgi:glucose-6-phosphate dehydrogenase assembly protein OpcA